MKKTPRIRTVVVLILVVVTVAVVTFYRDEIDALSAAGRATEDPAPSLESLRDAAATTTPDAFVMDLWRTGLLPQRRFAIALVRDRAAIIADNWEALRPIVMSAATTRDAQMATDALASLSRYGDHTATAWAQRGLEDPDPVLVRAWLDYLHAIKASEFASAVANVVEHHDPVLAARAAVILSEWTSKQWPHTPDASPDTRKELAESIRVWLADQGDKFTSPALTPGSVGPQVADAATEAFPIEIEDMTGKLITVGPRTPGPWLLHFFSVRTPTHESDFTAIAALTESGLSGLNVVHINTDLVGSTYDHEPGRRPSTTAIDAQLPEGVSVNARPLGDPMERAELDAVLVALASKLRVDTPIAVDPDGRITRAFAAQTQPAFVWIDSMGFIVRRFDGSRSLRVLGQMLEEVLPGAKPLDPLAPLDPLDPLAPVDPLTPTPAP